MFEKKKIPYVFINYLLMPQRQVGSNRLKNQSLVIIMLQRRSVVMLLIVDTDTITNPMVVLIVISLRPGLIFQIFAISSMKLLV